MPPQSSARDADLLMWLVSNLEAQTTCHRRPIVGPRLGDHFGVSHCNTVATQTKQRKRHRQAMVVMAVEHRSMQCPRHDAQAVRQLLHFGADGSQLRGEIANAVAFFGADEPDSANGGRTLGTRSNHRERGHEVAEPMSTWAPRNDCVVSRETTTPSASLRTAQPIDCSTCTNCASG